MKNCFLVCFILITLVQAACSVDPDRVKTELEGVWSTDCIKVSGKSYKENFQFQYNQFRRETVFFLDDACLSIEHIDLSYEEFTIKGDAEQLTEAKKLDTKLLSLERTYHAASAADEANTATIYGYSDWVPLEAKPTHDRALAVEAEQKTRTIHQAWYSIYQIAGNVLYIGDHFSKDGLTTENRAISLSDREYLRQ
ncbi:MAG: hypothetical protein HRU09_14610 [Oligoflexales bacterium]|nr:hypothetical protein [Oligoflexales bacterium]